MQLFAWLLLLSAPLAASARDPSRVPEDFKFCSQNKDCQIIPLRCACCTYDAIHRLHTADYLAIERDCLDPPCDCADHRWRPACEKGRCVLADARPASRLVKVRATPRPVPKTKAAPKPSPKRKGPVKRVRPNAP